MEQDLATASVLQTGYGVSCHRGYLCLMVPFSLYLFVPDAGQPGPQGAINIPSRDRSQWRPP